MSLGADGENLVFEHFPAGDFDAAQRDHVFARLEADVVGDMNGRNDEAELHGESAAQRFDAGKKLPALLRHRPD